MTFKDLSKIIRDNNIPDDVVIRSDSGWECSDTEMNGVRYNDSKNTIIFTQDNKPTYDMTKNIENWRCLSVNYKFELTKSPYKGV